MVLDFKVTNVFKKNWDAFNDSDIRYIVNSGGSRSSKTYSILQLFCILLLNNKNIKISCFRNKRVDSIDTMGQDFENIVNSVPGLRKKFIHRKKDATWTCKETNSFIAFAGTELVHKALGQANDYIFLNEISEFSEDVFRQLNQRCRSKVFLDFNPSTSSFIDKYKENPDAIFLHSMYTDNPFLSEGIVNTLRGYNPWEEGTVYLDDNLVPSYAGRPITDKWFPPPNIENIKNGTADKFMYLVYCLGVGAEKPNRVFRGWGKISDSVFDQLEYDSYFGLDFGLSSPTALLEVKYDGDRTFYVKERLYRPGQTLGMPLSEFLTSRINPPIGERLVIADSAKKAMVEDLQQAGLMAVGANKGPGSKARMIASVQGFNIYITESSGNIWEEYQNYSFKTDRYGIVTDEIENRNFDHTMDAIEYVIDYLVGYLNIVFSKSA